MTNLKELLQKQRDFVQIRQWDKFGSPKNLSMALAVEAAELMEEFMWLTDEQIESLASKHPERFQNVKEELADVLLYLLRIADKMQIDLLKSADEKIKKNETKHPVQQSIELAAKYS